VARRGLDNAGKTTIVKKFNGEDIDTIEPTLGFNIKTMNYRGSALRPPLLLCINNDKYKQHKSMNCRGSALRPPALLCMCVVLGNTRGPRLHIMQLSSLAVLQRL
jgi:hypothetical protein